MPKKYDEKFRAKAVRLVVDHVEEYASEWACITAVATRLSVSTETLRRWVMQARIDGGERDGVPTDTARELRVLKRKNRELEDNHRNPQGGNKFLRAGERPATPLICAFIAEHRARFGVAAAARRTREGNPLSGKTIHHSDYAGVCVKPRVCGDGLRSWGVSLDFSA